MDRSAAVVLAGVLLVLFLQVAPYEASRPLMDREVDSLLKELKSSLQRGPVPPSGPSGCTHVPGSNGPPCPSLVNQMNFAGINRNNKALHHHHHYHSTVSSSYPVVMMPIGLADHQQQ